MAVLIGAMAGYDSCSCQFCLYILASVDPAKLYLYSKQLTKFIHSLQEGHVEVVCFHVFKLELFNVKIREFLGFWMIPHYFVM